MKKNEELQKKQSYAAHGHTFEEVLTDLNSSVSGLSSQEAKERVKEHGYNEIVGTDKNNPVRIFLAQFKSVLVGILLLAALISYFFDHLVDTYVIIAIVILNAILGFVQEYRAQKAISALKNSLVLKATVYRDGELVEIPARELVPGDILSLEAGMFVPADARLIDATDFEASEAALTGESLPERKQTDALSKDTVLADRTNMVYMGTPVSKGVGRAVVVSTGHSTAIGKVATMLEQVEDTGSHFKKRAHVLALQMGGIAIVSSIIVFLVGYLVRGMPFEDIFLFTVASLVSGIPEGLPAILSIVLAVGAYRMSKHDTLVRTLSATETLGVTTSIITDKTGTLTQNVMMVERIAYNGGDSFAEVSGTGWEPVGTFTANGEPFSPLEERSLAKLLHIAGKGVSAHVARDEKTQLYHTIGDPTEGALVVLAHKAGLDEPTLFAHEHILREIPFNSEAKYRGSLIELRQHDEGSENYRELYVVGAPEKILEMSSHYAVGDTAHPLTDEVRQKYSKAMRSMSGDALRVIAFGYRTLSPDTQNISDTDVESLVFVGMVGMKDPIHADVPQAIDDAKKAGVRIIMATGDHKITALAVAREVGLVDKDIHDQSLVMTGADLEKLSDHEFAKAVRKINIFARLDPATKLRIAQSLQSDNQVVAMTGDGVNDALALKQADIGIAMGKGGTDVARQSSDIVLTEDNFASIVHAIREGRTVFTNTRRSATFLVSTNFAEHATILGTIALGLPLPLLPTQILWLNVITDGVAGVPISYEPTHSDVLDKKPRNKDENILGWNVIPFLIVVVGIMALGTLLVFNLFLPEGVDKARTGAFAVMSFTQIFNMINVRSLHESVFKIGLMANKPAVYAFVIAVLLTLVVLFVPFFQNIFHFTSLSVFETLAIVALSSLVFWFGEIYKYIRAKLVHGK